MTVSKFKNRVFYTALGISAALGLMHFAFDDGMADFVD